MRQPNLINTITAEIITALKTIDGAGDYLTDISESVFFYLHKSIGEQKQTAQRRIVIEWEPNEPEQESNEHSEAADLKFFISYSSAIGEDIKKVHDELVNMMDDIKYCIGLNRDTLEHDSIVYKNPILDSLDITDGSYPYGVLVLTVPVEYINYRWLDDGN
jgi:hypothetical protein